MKQSRFCTEPKSTCHSKRFFVSKNKFTLVVMMIAVETWKNVSVRWQGRKMNADSKWRIV
jgi:ABC-type transporter MlaC component